MSRGPIRAEQDLPALDAVYREHYAALVRVAFLLTGSAAAAEDAVHEVILRCAHRIDQLDHPASYLRVAVVNECRTRHRLDSRRAPQRPPPADLDLPHELLETRDALALLSPRRRTAVVLRYFADLTDDEIADILGCRPATVRSLVHRGLNQLREALT